MKLSVLCDCNVALIIFSSEGKLVQYSSTEEMDKLLERYAEACQQPHERHTDQDVRFNKCLAFAHNDYSMRMALPFA